MSTEQDKNKAMLDDEKFIDDLYAQLEKETINDDTSNECPSNALDNKILAAAHKSVSAKPKVVAIEREADKKVKKDNKPRAWYISAGLAASTVLAVSLVINQSDEVFISSQPDMEIMSLSDEVIVNEPVAIEAEALVLPAKAKHQKASLAKKEQISLLRSRQAEKSMRAASPIKPQNPSNNIAGFAMADTTVMSVQQIAEENEGKKFDDTPWLTTAQYQLFLKQKYLWSSIQESDSAYLLDIYKNDEQIVQYRLSKATFTITDFANANKKKYPFQQITMK